MSRDGNLVQRFFRIIVICSIRKIRYFSQSATSIAKLKFVDTVVVAVPDAVVDDAAVAVVVLVAVVAVLNASCCYCWVVESAVAKKNCALDG
jgi:hypothetical protein